MNILHLEHYQTLFQDDAFNVCNIQSIAVALLSAAVSTIIGTFGAISIYYLRNKKFKLTLLTLNNVLMIHHVVIGASFLIMFTALGHIFGLGLGFGTVLASHIAFCIPIVVILVLPQLYEMNHNMLNAARDLALQNLSTGRILLPNLMPAIIGGFLWHLPIP